MLLSKNTKVVLFPENFLEGQPVQHRKCIVVEHYDFCFSRNLNSFGQAYGEGIGSMATIRLRVGSRDSLKVFYERLAQNSISYFTLLFNVKYDDNDLVTDEYDGGLVMEGYLAKIDEEFLHVAGDHEHDESCITLSILQQSISCLGSSKNLTFEFK